MQVFKLQNKTGAGLILILWPSNGNVADEMRLEGKACMHRENQHIQSSCCINNYKLWIWKWVTSLQLVRGGGGIRTEINIVFFCFLECLALLNLEMPTEKKNNKVGRVCGWDKRFFFPHLQTKRPQISKDVVVIVLAVGDPNLVGLVDRSKSNTVVIVWSHVLLYLFGKPRFYYLFIRLMISHLSL